MKHRYTGQQNKNTEFSNALKNAMKGAPENHTIEVI
jgi:hypothetical protein